MMSEQSDATRSIRETNAFVRSLVETEATIGKYFWLGGVIRNYYKSDLGHAYFNLEDEGFAIRCMMPRTHLGNADIPLGAEMVVDAYGTIQVYEKRGQVQFIIEKVRLVDKGSAYIAPDVMLYLKEQKLWPRQKRDIPAPPRRIVLITSKNSAALNDFVNSYYAEGGKAPYDVLDVLIQGEQAPALIADAITRANTEQRGDVIVLIRGGGRTADLSTFDDIRVAEAICRSGIPVITGIGHHPDDTIADRVADQSTITPTAAAHHLAKLSPAETPEKHVQEPVSAPAPEISQTTIPQPPENSRNPNLLLYGIIIFLGIVTIILLILLANQGL